MISFYKQIRTLCSDFVLFILLIYLIMGYVYPRRSVPYEEVIIINDRDALEDSPASPVRNI